MLRRLLFILVPLAFLLVAALALPLGTVLAQQETQRVYVDRLSDAGRFASLGDTAMRTGRLEALDSELTRYAELYGIDVAVADPAGEVVAASVPPNQAADLLDSSRVQAVMTPALAGFRPAPPTAVWPWESGPLVLAEPIGRDSEVAGVVVLVSPTDRLRASILYDWAGLLLLSLVPLTGLAASAWPLSRWVLRPVQRLDGATAAVAQGDLSVRADAAGGPPELRRLAESFNAMVDVVQKAVERQRAFVSDASHQLRNPLASLRLAVENLAPFLTGPDARTAHQDAVEEAMAMHRMLNSLLAMTRLESFSGAAPVDMDGVLAAHAGRWRVLGAQRGVTVETRVPGGLWLMAPPGGLGSVLDELMSNATRLSGGTRVELRVRSADGSDPGEESASEVAGDAAAESARGAPDMVELHVSDDGVGLTDEERAGALRRFWRAAKHQNTDGTGLGLAICAELIRGAGGELRLESGLPRPDGTGHGLDVFVRLPLAPAPRPDATHGAPHEAAHGAAHGATTGGATNGATDAIDADPSGASA
ncbi:HAMP domain-containing sensor histidine kinase [Nocardiopsis rhodophaea]|uniref:HAMP domain-containing sensor histidine kinase n=1 Tax=Nocardiopsis rhodophaea TaxID=280238 RepID=UPI0031E15BC4